MSRVATYVYFDLETTGLPREELNKTRITELSMVAVKRDHILDSKPGEAPRVQQKLTLCFNPLRRVSDISTEITGLCNFLLEHEPRFDIEIYNLINNFLAVLTKPVCLIAHNGFHFDFPILKNHLEKLNVSLASDLLCADCYHGFYDLLEKKKCKTEQNTQSETNVKGNCNTINGESLSVVIPDEGNTTPTRTELDKTDSANLAMKIVNESTPKHKIVPSGQFAITKARRRLPFGPEPSTDSYKLGDIYQRVLKRPAIEAHRAEADCLLALEISTVLAKDYVQWVDNNCVKFSDIEPMKLGVPMKYRK